MAKQASPAGLKRHYVLVNRHVLAANRKNRVNDSALTARHGRHGASKAGRKILIHDSQGNVVAQLVQRPEDPLPCGATVYLECDHPPTILPS